MPPSRNRPRPLRATPSREPGELVRLNKYLAESGVASRRKCDELIAGGHVTVDDAIVTELGTKVDPAAQRVEVDGVVLEPRVLLKRYYLLNKPRHVVCTSAGNEGRRRAIDLITDRHKGRIYTVGRLDEDSTGLLLLTNDGEFAQRIAHPRHGIPKTYLVKVKGHVGPGALERLRKGVFLSEGKTAGAYVRVRKRTATFSVLTITLQEGKNREVRRMLARVGHDVLTLKRTRIGELSDPKLPEGAWRPLQRREVSDLLELAERASAAAFARGGPAALRPAARKTTARKTGGPARPAAQTSEPRGRRARGDAARPERPRPGGARRGRVERDPRGERREDRAREERGRGRGRTGASGTTRGRRRTR